MNFYETLLKKKFIDRASVFGLKLKCSKCQALNDLYEASFTPPKRGSPKEEGVQRGI